MDGCQDCAELLELLRHWHNDGVLGRPRDVALMAPYDVYARTAEWIGAPRWMHATTVTSGCRRSGLDEVGEE